MPLRFRPICRVGFGPGANPWRRAEGGFSKPGFCDNPNVSFIRMAANIVGMASRCVNNLGGKVLLIDVTPEEVNDYVRKHCKEYYEIPPGFVFKDIRMLLKSPMLVGLQIKKQKILLPFTKLCPGYGTMLYEVAAKEADLDFIRNNLEKVSAE